MELELDIYCENAVWAAAWPPDCWARTQRRIEDTAEFFGLGPEHVEFWSRSDGTGRIYYGAQVSPEFLAKEAAEHRRTLLVRAAYPRAADFDHLFLFSSPAGEEVVEYSTSGDPWEHTGCLKERGYRLVGKVATLMRRTA
jgi:hypothetical protein